MCVPWHVCVTWHIWCNLGACDITPTRPSFVCVTWLIHMSDMTHSHVRHDTDMYHESFICVPWLINICDMTHSHVWHDSFGCQTWLRYVPWLIHMCLHMSHIWCNLSACVKCDFDLFICVTWLIHMWDTTHSYVRVHVTHMIYSRRARSSPTTWLIYMSDMTQWQIDTMHDRTGIYRALLQKRPIK